MVLVCNRVSQHDKAGRVACHDWRARLRCFAVGVRGLLPLHSLIEGAVGIQQQRRGLVQLRAEPDARRCCASSAAPDVCVFLHALVVWAAEQGLSNVT